MSKMSNQAKISTLISGVALLASAPAQADLIITETEVIINDGFEYEFDLNGDDINDFVIRVGADDEIMPTFAQNILAPGLSETSQQAGTAEIQALGEGRSTFKTGSKLKLDKEFAFKFEEGGQVDGTLGDSSFDATLYSSFFFVGDDDDDMVPAGRQFRGPFANEGDRGFVGLSIREFGLEKEQLLIDGEIDQPKEEEQRIINYGWVELVRGSINVLRIGYQTTANAPAQIPGGPIAVSEPATLPLIALGAAGLIALRRRKAAK